MITPPLLYARDRVYELVVLCDLDSTICDTRQRHHLTPDRGGSWDEFGRACLYDEPIPGNVALLKILAQQYPIYFVSGRGVAHLSMTKEWLDRHDIPFESIRLHRGREAGDVLNNGKYKVAYIQQLEAEGIRPVIFLEDWPDVAREVEAHTSVPVAVLNPRYEDTAMLEHHVRTSDNPADPQKSLTQPM